MIGGFKQIETHQSFPGKNLPRQRYPLDPDSPLFAQFASYNDPIVVDN